MSLRYYQEDAVKAVYQHLKTKKTNPCVDMPVGSGKSWVLGKIAADAADQGGRVLVVAAARELLQQNAEKIRLIHPGIDLGIYSAGLDSRQKDNAVVVGGVQSIYSKAGLFGRRDILIIDECHLIPPDGDGMFRTLIAGLLGINPEMRIVGFTATPYRMHGGMICKPENILNEICYSIGLKELIEKGFLSPLVTKTGHDLADTSKLHIRGGEFVADEVEQVMNNSELVDRSCRELVERTRERKSVLVFCSSIAHCEAVAAKLESLTGEKAAIVTGETPSEVRFETLARFKGERTSLIDDGKPLKFVVNVECLTTGFDAPNIDAIALMRPTMSPGLLMQMCGRGTRLSPQTGKKDCLILDFGSNIKRLGCLDELHSPGDHEKRDGKQERAKACPKCDCLIPVAARTCPFCGHEFEPKKRELKITTTAWGSSALSGESRIERLNVVRTEYHPWTKRGAPAYARRTVRVRYHTNDGRAFCE